MSNHLLRHEVLDKVALYVAGLAITTLLTMQVNITSDLSNSTKQNQVELATVVAKVATVIENQTALRSTVQMIQMQTALTCDRLKILYPDRGYECK